MAPGNLVGIMTFSLLLLAAGVWLLIVGLRGRRVGDDPYCRRCGYNLTGMTRPLCPECGNDPRVTGMTRGVRALRRTPTAGGALLLTLSLPLLIASCTRLARQMDWYQYRPTAFVLGDAKSTVNYTAACGFEELCRRLKANELSTGQMRKLAEVALREEARSDRRWEPLEHALASLHELYNRGTLTDEQKVRFFDNHLRLRLTARPVADLPRGIPIEFRYGTGGEMPDVSFEYHIEPILAEGQSLSPDMDPGRLRGREHRHGGGSGSTSWILVADHLGTHEIQCRVTTRFFKCRICKEHEKRFGGSSGTLLLIGDYGDELLHETTTILRATTMVVPPDSSELVRTIHSPEIGEALRRAIRVEYARYETFGDKSGIDVVLDIRPPVAVAFDCVLDVGGEQFRSDPKVLRKGEGRIEPTWFPGVRPDITHVDLTLVPNPTLVERNPHIVEIWGESIRLEGLHVQPPVPTTTRPNWENWR